MKFSMKIITVITLLSLIYSLCYSDTIAVPKKEIVVVDKFSCPESNSQPYKACETLPNCLDCLKDADGVCNKYVKLQVIEPIVCEKCSRWARIFVCQEDPSLVTPLLVDANPDSQQLGTNQSSSSPREQGVSNENKTISDSKTKMTSPNIDPPTKNIEEGLDKEAPTMEDATPTMNDRKPTVENKLKTVKIKTPSVEDSAPSLNDVSESSNINTVDLPTLMRSDSKASPPIQEATVDALSPSDSKQFTINNVLEKVDNTNKGKPITVLISEIPKTNTQSDQQFAPQYLPQPLNKVITPTNFDSNNPQL